MSTPIITCGDSKPDATRVHAGMKPDYEVIYAGFSLPETRKELPLILSGQPPAASELHTQIASNEFDPRRRPVVVVVGGGYSDEAYEALYGACLEAVGGSKESLGVAFFRADNRLTDRLVAEGQSPAKHADGYAAAIAKRLKNKLAEVGVAHGLKTEDVGELFLY